MIKPAALFARKKKKRSVILDHEPEDLLDDEALVQATRFAEVPLTQGRKEKHDLCVLLQQQRATQVCRKAVKRESIRRASARATEEDGAPNGVYTSEKSRSSDNMTEASANGESKIDELPVIDHQSVPGSCPSSAEADAPCSPFAGAVNLVRLFGESTWQLSKPEPPMLPRKAFLCLSESNPVRRLCIRMALSSWFDAVILFVILTGSLMMALDAPGIDKESPGLKRVIVLCDEMTLYIFTAEMVVKVTAFGLICTRGTYLREPWNRLDALVVVSGWVSLITSQSGECDVFGWLFCAESSSGSAKFGAIRTVRVLRPLKAMNQLRGMRALVKTLLSSLPELMDSMVLCGFILVLFGIMGVQMFMGSLRQACEPVSLLATTLSPSTWGKKDVGLGELCALDGHAGDAQCAAGLTCVADAGENPNGGITSFDNLVIAMLAVFQSITLEGWVDIMYDIRKVKSKVHDVYFMALVLFGSLFMTNLVVGVLVANFIDAAAENKTLEEVGAQQTNAVKDGDFNEAESNEEDLAPCESNMAMVGAFTERVRQVDTKELPKFRRILFDLSSSERFGAIMIALIGLNTATLAMDNIISDDVLEIFNYIFTALFTLEMLIKLIGFGPRLYSRDGFNNFDFVIVVFSLVELLIAFAGGVEGGGSLTVLRTFRLLRVFKLARSMKSLRKILDAILSSLSSIAHLGVLLGMFMFVCALTGMASFGSTQDELDKLPPDQQKWSVYEEGYYEGRMVRPNFSTFLYSMTTVFIIITGENWNEVMYGAVQKNGWPSALYFIAIVIMGNYIILNLFLAILVEKFDTAGHTSEPFQENGDGLDISHIPTETSASSAPSHRRMSTTVFHDARRRGHQKADLSEARGYLDADDEYDVGNVSPDREQGAETTDVITSSANGICQHDEPDSFAEGNCDEITPALAAHACVGALPKEVEVNGNFAAGLKGWQKRSSSSIMVAGSIKEVVDEFGFQGSSLFCIGAKSKFRQFLWRVVQHPCFDQAIYGLIAVSAVILAMESPDEKDPETKHVFLIFDCVLSTCFTLEAICKIMVYGFMLGPHAYLRNSWNILDFFVVVTSGVNLGLTSSGGSKGFAWVKGLRALRALRPLRMVSRSEGLKVVVNSILLAGPAIADVLLVMLLFLIIFSILGVQLFKNSINRCTCMEWCPDRRYRPGSVAAEGKPMEFLCQGSCPAAPLHARTCRWERHPYWSFDNTALALLTLFEVSTLELWMDVMWLVVDGKSDGEGPAYDNQPLAVLFFIIFLFLMSFFILNLFVGVVIDKFTSVRNEMLGLSVLTDRQREWIATQRMLLKVKPRPLLTVPDSTWRQLVLQLISCREFEWIIMGLIISNIIMMCTTFHGSSDGLQRMQDNANLVFVCIFAAEAVVKMYALHPKVYFSTAWDTFDFVVVFGSVLQIAFSGIGIDATLLRMVRVARIFRLVKSMKSLRKLFFTLVMSLPSLAHIGVMLLLLFFVYAVAGMALFGDIQIHGNPELLGMSSDVNFENFYLAMVMLFRISTGESWNILMHDCFSGARCAEPPHKHECGNTAVAVGFFVSFMIIGSFVFVNLFIAVIIEKLFESEEDDSGDLNVTSQDLDNFVEAWARIAPDGSYYIPTIFLPALLADVEPPLGFAGEVMRKSTLIHCVANLGIRDHGGKVHFVETLWRLAAMVAGADMRPVAKSSFLKNINQMVLRAWPLPVTKDRCQDGVLYLAAQVIVTSRFQSLWRARQFRATFFQAAMQVTKSIRLTRQSQQDHEADGKDLEAVGKAEEITISDAQSKANHGHSDKRINFLDGSPTKDPLSLPKVPIVVPMIDAVEARGDVDGKVVVPPTHLALADETAPPSSLITAVLSSCTESVPACVVSCARPDDKHDTPPCEITLGSENAVELISNGTSHVMNVLESQPALTDPAADLCVWQEDDIERVASERSFNGLTDDVPPPSRHASNESCAPKKKLLEL